MVKIFGLMNKETAKKELVKEEQTTLNAKNRHIRMLENTLSAYEEQITALTDRLKFTNAYSREDRLIGLAEQYLPSLLGTPKIVTSPNKEKPISENAEISESQAPEGERTYTDEDILKILNRVPARLLSGLVAQGKEAFILEAKQKIPNISQESSERAYLLADEILNKEVKPCQKEKQMPLSSPEQ